MHMGMGTFLGRDREWFILIQGKKEGPYTPLELKRDARVTPDTFVWKEGFPNWIALRYVPELKDLFKEEKTPDATNNDEESLPDIDLGPYQMVLTLQKDPPHLILWFFLALLIILYVFYKLSYRI